MPKRAQPQSPRQSASTPGKSPAPLDMPLFLIQEYSSAVEAIGTVSLELIRTRGYLSYNDILLRLMVQVKLCNNKEQQDILQEALALINDKT